MLLDFHTGPTQSSDMMDFKELTSTKGSNIGRAEVKIKMERNPLAKLSKKTSKHAKWRWMFGEVTYSFHTRVMPVRDANDCIIYRCDKQELTSPFVFA